MVKSAVEPMTDHEFADVAHQFEDTTSKLKAARDPKLRLTLLARMRRLLAEADRLLSDEDADSDAA